MDGAVINHLRTAGAQIGPNAVIQLLAALRDYGLLHDRPALATRLAAEARVNRYLIDPPDSMAPLEDACALFNCVLLHTPAADHKLIFVDAAQRTADYIARRRIPAPVRFLLRTLPKRWAISILARAIEKHAWTFVGDGAFKLGRSEKGWTFLLEGGSLRSPDDCWHQRVIERLFQSLIDPSLTLERDDMSAHYVRHFFLTT